MTLRIGHGVDVHRLVADRSLMLGGIQIPYPRGLAGHSDGDAVAHALADAVLGGAGLGDLGRHFPSSDPAWRDASGLELLGRAAAMAAEAGWRLTSAHVVAVADQPRLSPHTSRMAAAMAEALGIGADQLAVSATTTDGLGLVGRGEGIAASAVVLLSPVS